MAILLTVIAGILAVVEVSTHFLLPRVSRVESRVTREYEEAIRMSAGNRPSVLVAGNSLLLHAVQVDPMQRDLSNVADVRRFVVEDTTYRDWEYGLQRLFHYGMRPKVIVLMLSSAQFLMDSVRGDYFANRLMLLDSLPEVASTLRLHPTVAANMAFANVSYFYGLRSEIRKVILGRMIPQLPQLTATLIRFHPPSLTVQDVDSRAPSRLRTLANLCERHGTRFVLALPPSAGYSETTVALEEAAKNYGIPVLRAYSEREFTKKDFYDGFHMAEPISQRVFTPHFVEALRIQLPRLVGNQRSTK